MKQRFDFIKAKKIAFSFSGLVIVLGIVFFIIGGFRYGSDFQGGIQLTVNVGEEATANEVSDAVGGSAIVTQIGSSSNEFLIKAKLTEELQKELTSQNKIDEITKTKLENPLKAKYAKLKIKERTTYNPTQGAVIKERAMEVSLLILVLILFYIGLRFQFKFGIAAIVALVHDILFVLACFLFLDHEVDIPTVVAILTIMGYSLNDTIVVFDRIRENTDLIETDDYALVVNKSIYQSLSRTVVTSLTTLFVVLCLRIWGGPALESLSTALIIGVIIGTYSSVFVASPVLIIWENFMTKRLAKLGKNKKPIKKKKQERQQEAVI